MSNRAATIVKGINANPNTYNYLDEFTTPQLAPISSPRTAQPGPGQLALVDTNSIMSIAQNSLVVNGTSAIATDYVSTNAVVTRAVGAAFLVQLEGIGSFPFGNTAGSVRFGYNATQNAAGAVAFDIGSVFLRVKRDATVITTITNLNLAFIECMFVMRASGGWLLRRSAKTQPFIMEYIYAVTTTNQYGIIFLNNGEARNFRIKKFRQLTLPAPWTTDSGIAVYYDTTPTNNDTGTAANDGWFDFTWVAASNETFEFSFRRTDDNNRWIIRASQAGSTVKIIQVEGGVETERASSAATINNGTSYRMLFLADGPVISGFFAGSNTDNLTATTYSYNTSNAGNFNDSAIGIKVSGFTSASNLFVWPRRINISDSI